jgi:SAM-dependent methyltransferase
MSERSRWDAYYSENADRSPGAPSGWVLERALSLPAGGLVLDLASGRGRHAIPLVRAGRRVVALDIAVGAVRAVARAGAHAVVADAAAMPLGEEVVDAILCVNFLDRALFMRLAALLRPGGSLIVETFTVDQRKLGRGPTSGAHLLEPLELPRLVAPLEVIESFEGLVDEGIEGGERYVARVLAVKGRGGDR